MSRGVAAGVVTGAVSCWAVLTPPKHGVLGHTWKHRQKQHTFLSPTPWVEPIFCVPSLHSLQRACTVTTQFDKEVCTPIHWKRNVKSKANTLRGFGWGSSSPNWALQQSQLGV